MDDYYFYWSNRFAGIDAHHSTVQLYAWQRLCQRMGELDGVIQHIQRGVIGHPRRKRAKLVRFVIVARWSEGTASVRDSPRPRTCRKRAARSMGWWLGPT